MPITAAVVEDFGGIGGFADAKYISLTFDGSYASGGEVVDPTEVGMASFHVLLIEETDLSGTTYNFAYDRSADKVLAFQQDGTQATGDISAMVPRALAIGPRG